MTLPSSPLSPEDLTALRRLLALKRHEVPPPGYFQGFSGRVIARIEAEGLRPHRAWWVRWFEHFVARPALAGALGLVAGATLMFGVSAAQALRPDPSGAPVWLGSTPAAVQAVLVNVRNASPASTAHEWIESDASASSIAPVLDHASPFARASLNGAQVQRASYYPVR